MSSRLTIVTGHYGCGKTELAVNLAIQAAKYHHQVVLADLDTVNPYFRARENETELLNLGVRLISHSNDCANADVPSLPPEIKMVIQDQSCCSIIDMGGDAVGARVIRQYREWIREQNYQMLFVLNANRPLVAEVGGAVEYLRRIEEATGLLMSGIVNNTHLCQETTKADIKKGFLLAEKVAQQVQLPVLYHAMEKRFVADIELPGEKLALDLKMKKPWEIGGV